jgi:probable F420-dependent oxidoreductase
MTPLSVRIGIAPNPFASRRLSGPAFWDTIALMEELGYDSIWLSDTAGLGGLAPIPALAAIAARTERLKLGTSVLVLPPRNPVLLARELATIDVISGGRLLPAGGLGIGLPAELEAMGVAGEERVARLEESVALIKALWSGEPVTHRGRFWSVTELRLTPRPTKGKLEFWLGGRAPAALRRIGRIADGWLASFVGPDEFAGMVDVIRASAAQAGRSIDADHYGATIFAVPSEDELPAGVLERLAQRGGLSRADHVSVGTAALGTLVHRFIDAGASKFVVVPIAEDFDGWLRRLYAEVVAPVESRS